MVKSSPSLYTTIRAGDSLSTAKSAENDKRESMMLGEPNPTVHVPPWSPTLDDYDPSPFYLSHHPEWDDSDESDSPESPPVDAFSCDQFRMFEFKVRRCARGRSHDWTECPYAHPGEKARRRDPRRFHYSGAACPDFRKGHCRRGDACELAHGVFECWLHPARYRTQPCKDGAACRRRVCFFAHAPDQLRVLSPRASDSPPSSPATASELVAALRSLQLGKVKSLPPGSPGFGSPRGASLFGSGFCSLPTTPTRVLGRAGFLDYSEVEEEPAMERVESGRGIRARMLQKLRSENSVEPNGAPDVGWVSELVM